MAILLPSLLPSHAPGDAPADVASLTLPRQAKVTAQICSEPSYLPASIHKSCPTSVFGAAGEVFFHLGGKYERCQLARTSENVAGKTIFPGVLAKPFPRGHVPTPQSLPEKINKNKNLNLMPYCVVFLFLGYGSTVRASPPLCRYSHGP